MVEVVRIADAGHVRTISLNRPEKKNAFRDELAWAVDADPAAFVPRVEADQGPQRDGGHSGAPLIAFAGEPVFGEDRFDQMVWRLRQEGLPARAAATATAS